MSLIVEARKVENKRRNIVVIMSDFNCLATSALDPFIIDTSDLSYFHNRPRRLSGGAIMLCVKGEAEAIVDLQSFRIDLHTQIFLMPRTIFMLSNVSADFQVQFFAFSEAAALIKMVLEAMVKVH